MFNFGQKYHIPVQARYEYRHDKVSYIKDIDERTHTYTVTSDIQLAKSFRFNKLLN